jgi:hypothetical protein
MFHITLADTSRSTLTTRLPRAPSLPFFSSPSIDTEEKEKINQVAPPPAPLRPITDRHALSAKYIIHKSIPITLNIPPASVDKVVGGRGGFLPRSVGVYSQCRPDTLPSHLSVPDRLLPFPTRRISLEEALLLVRKYRGKGIRGRRGGGGSVWRVCGSPLSPRLNLPGGYTGPYLYAPTLPPAIVIGEKKSGKVS